VGPGYQLPVFILINSKKPRKNPNLFKTNPEKYLKIKIKNNYF
jgi:hypothetical protein